jgi:carboxylesterase
MRHLPNLFIWWDQKAKAKIAGAPQAYPRFATRSLGEIVALGRQVRRAARTTPPVAKQMALILSDSDAAVHRGLVAQLAADWQRHAPGRVIFQRFPAHLRIHHDMVDPTQPTQRVDLVYPLWSALAGGELREKVFLPEEPASMVRGGPAA